MTKPTTSTSTPKVKKSPAKKPGVAKSSHPTSLRIGSQRFKVSSREVDFNKASVDSDDTECYGFMDYRKSQITMDPDQTLDCMRDTLVHEILHAIWMQSGATARFPSELEEQVVMLLSNGILQVLKDNPTLIEYLTEK